MWHEVRPKATAYGLARSGGNGTLIARCRECSRRQGQHQPEDDRGRLLTSTAAYWTIRHVSQPIEHRWRGPITDAEMVALVTAHGGQAEARWWDQVRPHSLGWVTARLQDGGLVGFVNVAWDGGDHAFLLDTKVASEHQRQGIATALVGHAAQHAKAAGCEWLHVDFEEHLAAFYFDTCGFQPTPAGLIRLSMHRHDQEPAGLKAGSPTAEVGLSPSDSWGLARALLLTECRHGLVRPTRWLHVCERPQAGSKRAARGGCNGPSGSAVVRCLGCTAPARISNSGRSRSDRFSLDQRP